jgi:hypothetical protein
MTNKVLGKFLCHISVISSSLLGAAKVPSLLHSDGVSCWAAIITINRDQSTISIWFHFFSKKTTKFSVLSQFNKIQAGTKQMILMHRKCSQNPWEGMASHSEIHRLAIVSIIHWFSDNRASWSRPQIYNNRSHQY